MDEETEKYISEEMRKARELSRKHANFYNWHKKEVKEYNICGKLLRYLTSQCGEKFEDVRREDDPPDFIVQTCDREIAIELAELVDQEAIENQIKHKLAYPEQEGWTTDSLMRKINGRIAVKDNPKEKESLAKRFGRYIVLLHTDEPELHVDVFDNLFRSDEVAPTSLVNEVYLLFSFDPSYGTCPVKRLK